ncbi:MAG: thioredoxin domain-containing protein [Chloroflexota bacterium]
MWFGHSHNDVVPRRAIVIRDIMTAFVIFGAALAIVWYAVTQQSAAVAVDTTNAAEVQDIPAQQERNESRQSRAVVYMAYPCEACRELLSALAALHQDDDETSQAPNVIYRPIHLDTPASQQAAYALLCAQEQAMFEAYYAALPAPSEASHSALWRDTAQQVGLDQTAFVTCFEREHTAAQVAVYTDMMQRQGIATPPVVERTSWLTDTTDPTHVMQFIQPK